MPLYEFVCRDCNQEQELLVRGDEKPTCESCGGVQLVKLLSVPAAHLGGEGGVRPMAGPSGGGREMISPKSESGGDAGRPRFFVGPGWDADSPVGVLRLFLSVSSPGR